MVGCGFWFLLARAAGGGRGVRCRCSSNRGPSCSNHFPWLFRALPLSSLRWLSSPSLHSSPSPKNVLEMLFKCAGNHTPHATRHTQDTSSPFSFSVLSSSSTHTHTPTAQAPRPRAYKPAYQPQAASHEHRSRRSWSGSGCSLLGGSARTAFLERRGPWRGLAVRCSDSARPDGPTEDCARVLGSACRVLAGAGSGTHSARANRIESTVYRKQPYHIKSNSTSCVL